jgi:hypothetical protein
VLLMHQRNSSAVAHASELTFFGSMKAKSCVFTGDPKMEL